MDLIFFNLNYYFKYFCFWFAKFPELTAEAKTASGKVSLHCCLYDEGEDLMFVKLALYYSIGRRSVYVTCCL